MPEILTRDELAEMQREYARDGWFGLLPRLIASHEALRARLEERDSFILNMQHAAKLDHDDAVNAATRKAFEEAADRILDWRETDWTVGEMAEELRRRAAQHREEPRG